MERDLGGRSDIKEMLAAAAATTACSQLSMRIAAVFPVGWYFLYPAYLTLLY